MDNMRKVKGKKTYANGDVYEGDLCDDKAHGKGKLWGLRVFSYNYGDMI